MSIINFGKETRFAITVVDHFIDDIAWIGNYNFRVDIDEFFKVADNTNYNNGYGTSYIPIDLMIVFKNGDSLHRFEYDGSERWRFYPSLTKPTSLHHFKIDKFTDIKYCEKLNECVL